MIHTSQSMKAMTIMTALKKQASGSCIAKPKRRNASTKATPVTSMTAAK